MARLLTAVLTLVLAPSLTQTAFAASVIVTWDRSPDADIAGYVVTYGVASRNYYASASVSGAVTSYQIDGLPAGQPYYFVVEARNSAGAYSDPSNELLVVAPSDMAPRLCRQPAAST